MWWDDRTVLNLHSVLTSEQGSTQGDHEKDAEKQLHASVDLDDPYLRLLVTEALSRRPAWRVTNELGRDEEITSGASCSDLHWGEYERFDWGRVHQGGQAASSYCMRKGLCRKAHLAHNLKKWGAKHPEGHIAAAVPETFILSVDDVEYIDEALSDLPEVRDMEPGSAQWIAKPSVTNQGLGIAVIDSCAGLRAALEAQPELREWVVQRYIRDPLLIGDRKFHLRAYVLCVGKLQVYVWSEMLALFAGAPYGQDLTDLRAHLTNTCRQSSAAVGSGDAGYQEADAVKLLSELPEALTAEGMTPSEAQERLEGVTQKARAIIGECLEAVSHELTFFPLPDCFALFGFDLMVDQEWRVWLLEANADPDFAQTGERLQGVVADLVEGTLQLVADPLATAAGWVDSSNGGAQPHTPLENPEQDHDYWVPVYQSRAGGYTGSSGISVR
mmetsp:Transcript_2633/g.7837  ORF Transcript_2633/g.7837 Transcript_2633/m.7837 type:complete len:443 (-) Transcript_2633:1024-2352(-)